MLSDGCMVDAIFREHWCLWEEEVCIKEISQCLGFKFEIFWIVLCYIKVYTQSWHKFMNESIRLPYLFVIAP